MTLGRNETQTGFIVNLKAHNLIIHFQYDYGRFSLDGSDMTWMDKHFSYSLKLHVSDL